MLAAGCQQPEAIGPLRLADLQPVDPAKAARDAKGEMLWYDARELVVEGRGWNHTEEFYHRLPAKAKGVVPKSVWGLSTDSAGLCVRFVTDASRIAARWTVTSKSLAMPHMPATGVSGLDLYVRHQGKWRWLGAGRPVNSPTNEVNLVDNVPAGPHEYLLYLPLYNGIKSLEIGVAPSAILSQPPPRPATRSKPILVYGTSIAQGGCASRPGMAHVAILGRMLERPTVNLGFSGSGKMEPAMADLLCEVDAAVYVLDCLPNMTTAMVSERIEPFVETLRKARPHTPIVLVENELYEHAAVLPDVASGLAEKNGALRNAYEQLKAKGVGRLTYVSGDGLLGGDGEGAVDGVHPTDLGFLRIAQALAPVLRGVLEQ
ncbi:MAG: SGNH/GDSL hydrolase family protein [Phycisphaerae bacterium]|nr:SGNH/GDSL hydrolase family protein [Phycisphaerae bacterium]